MTAKTHGYITKEIELEQIYQFVLKYFDPEAKVTVMRTASAKAMKWRFILLIRVRNAGCLP